MNASLAFAEAVAVRCEAALGQRKIRSDSYRIGSLTFRLTAPADAGGRWIGSAFLPAETDSIAASGYRLQVWDGIAAETAPPARPWGPMAHEPLGLIEGFCDEAVRCAFDIHTSSLTVHHAANNAGYLWYPELAALPAWAQASPFRIPLSWFANRHGQQIVHAAAVAVDGRAALIAGGGGAGKSTTALACALSGMSYLGDDYCVIEPAARKVHMLYQSAKLLRSSLDMLPAVRPWLANADRVEREKGVMFLDPSRLPLTPSAEVAAILLPRVTGAARTTLRKGSSRDALHAILPSTIGGLMGGTAATPRLLMALAASAPVYHIDLGSEIASVPDTVASVLERIHA
ncbi:MAG TPA: hypothetical protein VHA10_15585 [Hypericibacter adhaerens]|jgi:hypothetical protein|uniref:hypothetical protein n=1 Tax=Hypericibacter adhaerens TaxID=2602016 RepID=UPI002BCBBDF0|nr:hypothetical protein [Hypericibacter adhaerens]HWA44638.1 hypothetical protein [Hypericibacter adhaerens]